jgi:hypothetical protein
MGANHVGEIALLAKIADPTHGLITNIGKAHIGTFGGLENVIRGKSELYLHLMSRQGQVFINSRNPELAAMAHRFKEPLFYPAAGDYYHCELISADPFIKLKSENGQEVDTHLIGTYNFFGDVGKFAFGGAVSSSFMASYRSKRAACVPDQTTLSPLIQDTVAVDIKAQEAVAPASIADEQEVAAAIADRRQRKAPNALRVSNKASRVKPRSVSKRAAASQNRALKAVRRSARKPR